MHMNLKAANVLLTKTYNIAKIGDVDQAQVMSSNTRQQHPAPFAISAYLAPELVLGGKCTEKVSINLTSHMPLCILLYRVYVCDMSPAYGDTCDQETSNATWLAETKMKVTN